MKRTVKRIIVLVLAFAFGVGVRLYGQVSTVMPKMSADSAAKVQAGADRYVMSCWEGIDYSRFNDLDMDAESEIKSNAERLENKLAAYFWVLRLASDSVAQMSVSKLMDSVAASCGRGEYPTGYDKVMEAAERYFYTPDSPYYSEKRLLLFLSHKIGRTDIDEVYKARSRYLATIVRRNSVGSKAEDFEIANYDVIVSLNHILGTADYQLLVFFTADCPECREGIRKLAKSPILNELVTSHKAYVKAICVDGNSAVVKNICPKTWGSVWKDCSNIVENNLYSIRHSPSVYILDKEGIVLLKDASVSEALDFLLEK